MARRGRRRRAGLIDTLVGGATEVVQSVAIEIVPGVVKAIDIDAVVRRVDVQAIVDQVDVESVVERVDVDSVVDKLDVQAVVDKLDVQSVLDKVDIQSLAERVDLQDAHRSHRSQQPARLGRPRRARRALGHQPGARARRSRRRARACRSRPARRADRRPSGRRPPRPRSSARPSRHQRAARPGRHRRAPRPDRARLADRPFRIGGGGSGRGHHAEPRRDLGRLGASLGEPADAPRSRRRDRVDHACSSSRHPRSRPLISADRHLVSGLEGHYAGFVTRFGAFLVDIVVIAVVFAIGGRVLEFVLSILLRHRFELSRRRPGVVDRSRPVGLHLLRLPAGRRRAHVRDGRRRRARRACRRAAS